ncbi:mannose-6-phosphate isomerase, class I [Nocardioides sambongensis]|uniref:mannose-6-phosphate isomerase, class I n=1 Tax=Nocardioides sambongensis TaxID=2589074 RepID=UPI00112E6952|nr:mannose-6-phosphate isomerase, class I [Nocardioides sambongensis]
MYPLDCPTQDYDWGSTDGIPTFLRQSPGSRPVAEVWMGTHPLGVATVRGSDEARPLTDVAGELGFMLKILAADRPLSIQVHPNASTARAGFEAEEASGVPLESRDRVFKDPHPKPEMVYALSQFDTLVGFRPTAEILRVLAQLDTPLTQVMAAELRNNPGFAGIVKLVEKQLLSPPSAEEITAVVDQCSSALERGFDIRRAYLTAVELQKHHPGDIGVLISLLLNRLTLQPGEAAFLDAGIIHAHLAGMCLEVMVSSDNVLRAGLTSKHIAAEAMVHCLEEGMSRVARVNPELFGFSTDIYQPGSGDFALSVTQVSQAEPAGAALPERGKRILVCTAGDVALLNEQGESLWLARGDSAYADESDGTIRVVGTGEVAQAYQPTDVHAGRLNDLV